MADIVALKPQAGAFDYPTKLNQAFDALQVNASGVEWPFGYNPSTTSGLTFGIFGGSILVDGVLTSISDQTVALTDAATNYVEATRAGVVSKNTTGFTAGRLPLYTIVTSGGAISTMTDVRCFNQPSYGRLALTTTGGTTVLSYIQSRVNAIDVSGQTSNATLEVPAVPWQWVINNTSGTYTVTVKVNGQTGVVVPASSRKVCYCDGTDVRALTGYVPTEGGTMTGTLTLSGDPTNALHAATKQYADDLVIGLLDDRGNYNASVNTWPASGGSGAAGAIMKGDVWYISVAGTLGGTAVEIGDVIRALSDAPGQTASNWSVLQKNDVAATDTVAGRVELATTAETQTGSDATRAVTPVGLAGTAVYQGKHSFAVTAAALRPRATSGCTALATTNGASNQPDVDYLAFNGTTTSYAKFAVQMPLDWNGGTITAKFCWRRASGTGAANVMWGIRAVSVADNETPAVTFGTVATVTDDAKTTTANFSLSGETGACTIAGTPAAGELVFFEVSREAGNVADTLDAVDAWLSCVVIFYTTNAKTE